MAIVLYPWLAHAAFVRFDHDREVAALDGDCFPVSPLHG
jgi:hypothetical protein